jgi:hypothetical protein
LDGISYLDMADAYIRADWGMALNGLWSPLYSWILGLAMLAVKPSPYWEFATLQAVNFAVFLFALFCFEFFLNELMRCDRDQAAKDRGHPHAFSPERLWPALGYPLFIWSSLRWIYIFEPCPDLCLSAFIYLACGLVLRIRGGDDRWRTFAFLGAILGLGYLTKAPMFILGFVFLLVSLFSAGNIRRTFPRVLTALVIFLLIGGPLIVALSRTKGRLTFSDAARLNYIWHVNDLNVGWNNWPHWKQGLGNGIPLHTSRKIFDEPAVYEFATPVGGTYPMWYDPSYWYDGVSPRFNITEQKEELKETASFYYNFFFLGPQCGLIVGLLLLYFMFCNGRSCLKYMARHWHLLIPPALAMSMYGLVHVEARYIGAYVVVLWLALFSGLYPLVDERKGELMYGVIRALKTVFLVAIAFSIVPAAYTTARGLITGKDASANVHWQIADELMRMGLEPGDKIAIIGYGQGASVWARLARAQIIAETLRGDVNTFWATDETVKSQVIDTFARTGARIIVAEKGVCGPPPPGWQKMESAGYYVYFLPGGS